MRPKITAYRVLPPKMRIIYPEGSQLSATAKELRAIDDCIDGTKSRATYSTGSFDLVNHVFTNQLSQHGVKSYQIGKLIADRVGLADRHLRDIDWRFDQLWERRPFRPKCLLAAIDDHKLTDVEKQLLDLEKQKRQTEDRLWRDVLDLRQALVEERQQYHETRTRMTYLSGGDDAAA